jgi:hypothetical protein
MDFVVSRPLVRLVLPPIRFLFVGSRVCSTLPSDGPSRDLICPCASLALRLHQAVQGTCTPKLLSMPDTQLCRPVGPGSGAKGGGHGTERGVPDTRCVQGCGQPPPGLFTGKPVPVGRVGEASRQGRPVLFVARGFSPGRAVPGPGEAPPAKAAPSIRRFFGSAICSTLRA